MALVRARAAGGYLQSTRNPLICLLFVLPLLVTYEAGMLASGNSDTRAYRNGADVWLRDALTLAGMSGVYAAPALIVLVLLVWGLWRRQQLPKDVIGTTIGMACESVLFAVGLVGLSHALRPLLIGMQRAGFVSTASETCFFASWGLDATTQQMLHYLGAGLYEETLFRLVLFSALWGLFTHWQMPSLLAFLSAGLLSALCFAGAHHLGPHGEAFHLLLFLFRTFAGWYFAWVFYFRGFAIAVGAHALYDVLVGVLLRM